jgi:hypothetical protein
VKSKQTSLVEPLRNLQNAIGRYGRQWAGAAEDSDELMAMAQAALDPIDRLRARQLSGPATQPEVPVDPTTAVPDLPEPPIAD